MQANIYMDYEGVVGEATADGFKDQVTVMSLNFNVQRLINSYTGTTKDREASSARLGDITITKLQDNATPKLLEEATVGKGKKCVFHMTTQGEDSINEIIKIDLTDALISSFSMSASGDRPFESLTISYTSIEVNVIPTDDKTKATKPLRYGYSGITGKKF